MHVCYFFVLRLPFRFLLPSFFFIFCADMSSGTNRRRAKPATNQNTKWPRESARFAHIHARVNKNKAKQTEEGESETVRKHAAWSGICCKTSERTKEREKPNNHKRRRRDKVAGRGGKHETTSPRPWLWMKRDPSPLSAGVLV